MKNRMAAVLFLTECLVVLATCAAQNIQVDATPAHSTNHFVPNQTLGAGVDRIPAAAIDNDLLQPTLQQVFAAGWQPVCQVRLRLPGPCGAHSPGCPAKW